MCGKMEEPEDDGKDMLGLAFRLTETSRLGRHYRMVKDLDGMHVKLPRGLEASDFEWM